MRIFLLFHLFFILGWLVQDKQNSSPQYAHFILLIIILPFRFWGMHYRLIEFNSANASQSNLTQWIAIWCLTSNQGKVCLMEE